MFHFIRHSIRRSSQNSTANTAKGANQGLAAQINIENLPPLTYVVGDIHGCIDLYRVLEDRIAEDANGNPVLVILVGDLIDRGPDSSAVISHVMGPAPEGLQRLTLMGNHEEMFVKFLGAPRANIRWLEHGGLETLASYGLRDEHLAGFDLPEAELSEYLHALIPNDHVAWVRNLPSAVQLGGQYFVSHSGIDPKKPLSDQTVGDLRWTRHMKFPPPSGITVVHGHTPTQTVETDARYINVDTGAYASGRLSALRIMPGKPPTAIEVS